MYTKTFAEIILFDGTKRIISIMNPKNFVEAVENLVAEKVKLIFSKKLK